MKTSSKIKSIFIGLYLGTSAFANHIDFSGTYLCNGTYGINSSKFSSDMVISVKDGKYQTQYTLDKITNNGTSNTPLGQDTFIEHWDSKYFSGITYWKMVGKNLTGTSAILNHKDGKMETSNKTCQKK